MWTISAPCSSKFWKAGASFSAWRQPCRPALVQMAARRRAANWLAFLKLTWIDVLSYSSLNETLVLIQTCLIGSGQQMCKKSSVQHQNSQTDLGRGDVSAEDVLESSSSQLWSKPEEGLRIVNTHLNKLQSCPEKREYVFVQEQCMQEEILSLKLRISEQEEVLRGTIQRLRSTSRTKENMEHFIVSQCEYEKRGKVHVLSENQLYL